MDSNLVYKKALLSLMGECPLLRGFPSLDQHKPGRSPCLLRFFLPTFFAEATNKLFRGVSGGSPSGRTFLSRKSSAMKNNELHPGLGFYRPPPGSLLPPPNNLPSFSLAESYGFGLPPKPFQGGVVPPLYYRPFSSIAPSIKEGPRNLILSCSLLSHDVPSSPSDKLPCLFSPRGWKGSLHPRHKGVPFPLQSAAPFLSPPPS